MLEDDVASLRCSGVIRRWARPSLLRVCRPGYAGVLTAKNSRRHVSD